MRGENICVRKLWVRKRGNIPACAGKTNPRHAMLLRIPEHPRVRGENRKKPQHGTEPVGTSPRARGKLRGRHGVCYRQRNIPACAGKTCWRIGSVVPLEEHPRVRGENKPLDEWILTHIGTSPRARGKHRLVIRWSMRSRNIPACAGKTICIQGDSHTRAEHPRVRGENGVGGFPYRSLFGTSPRARGKLRSDPATENDLRNIPACAGKTTGPSSKLAALTGTSPRARGKRRYRLGQFL